MARKHNSRRSGFSLIELVIVVVIIGIIAAIAIPRMSRGTAGAADSALGGNLSVLRNAIELFATEHGGKFPEQIGTAGTDTIDKQLTQYTDDKGEAKATKDSADANFLLTIHSAISGRPLEVMVEQKGNGEGTAYLSEDPRVFFAVVDAANIDWTFTIEEPVDVILTPR